MEPHALLRDYIDHQSEQAFAELVERHIRLVYAVALRIVGDTHTAEDVVQTVFIQLARKAHTVREGQALAGWLYRTTRHAALAMLRANQRRHQREQAAMISTAQEKAPPAFQPSLTPLLDEALQRLNRGEQDALLLRYFEGCSLRETGAALALNESATHKRITRALEKIRRYFADEGVTITPAVVATGLAAHLTHPVPAGLAAKVTGGSLAVAGSAAWAGPAWKTFYMTTKTKIFLAVAAAAVVTAVPVSLYYHETASTERATADNGRGINHTGAVAKLSSPGLPNLANADQGKAALLRMLAVPGKAARLRELVLAAAEADAPQVRALLNGLSMLPAGEERDRAQQILLDRWVQLDPAAALAWASNLGKSGARSSALTDVFDAWSARDPKTALASLDQVENLSTRLQAMDAVLANYVSSDPQAVLKYLDSLPADQQPAAHYAAVYSAWAMKDPAAAAASVLEQTASYARNSAIEGVALGWAAHDAAGALAWTQSLPPGKDHDYAAAGVLRQMAAQDPQGTIAYLDQLPNTWNRWEVVQELAASWAQQDPAAALKWLDTSTNSREANGAVWGVISSITASDPANAAKLIHEMADSPQRTEALQALAEQWAKQDVKAAADWALSLPQTSTADTLRQEALQKVLNSWSVNDPVASAAFVQNLGTSADSSKLAGLVAHNWAGSDPQAALQWAQTLPEGAAHDNALRNAISGWAVSNGAAAAALAQSLPPGDNRDRAIADTAAIWSSQQPLQAAALLSKLPEGDVRSNAVGSLVHTWLGVDPPAASTWVNSLPSGASRDAAIEQLVTSAEVRDDPKSKFTWAITMTNETARLVQLQSSVQQWARKDSAAAIEAIQNASLTDAQRNDLLQAVQKEAARAANR